MTTDTAITGLGVATPMEQVDQRSAAELASRLSPATGHEAAWREAMYRRSGVERRGAVASHGLFEPASEDRPHGPTTARRLAAYDRHAAELAARAATDALRAAGLGPSAITHVVTASCTGMSAPGVDAALIERLGLPRTVQRLHVGFMGCHAALNALRAASALVATSGGTALVACVEVCSVHFQYGTRRDHAVANAIFADGAAAAVVTRSSAAPSGAIGIGASVSALLPGTAQAMAWTIGDHGFEMTLSASVPEMIERHGAGVIGPWLSSLGVEARGVGGWCVHPGGPRVLGAVERALGLDESATSASREVLARHGNMSSPTVLFILEELRRHGVRGSVVMLAFGPGLTIEGLLVRM